MRNSIVLSRKSRKFFESLTDASLYSRLKKAIDELENNAFPQGCSKLSGEKDLYRVRVGDYRIVYQAKGNAISILAIGHRREIYR